MSLAAVRSALEVALDGVTPKLATAWPNVSFTPPAPGTPYQTADLMLAEPLNQEIGRQYVERGFLQVTLRYPLNKGPALADARAGLLRTTFYRGSTFTASGVKVIIERTPEIMGGFRDGDRWSVPVRIRFYAEVYPA
jgi:hypothetical protein